jgi:diacylglycerol kinase family enzyme
MVTISGDGMLHEVFNGLASAGHGCEPLEAFQGQPVSIIPGGTSNGIATTMTHSMPFLAAKKLVEGDEVPVDLYRTQDGNFQSIWDCHVLSWGIIAEHDSLVEQVTL